MEHENDSNLPGTPYAFYHEDSPYTGLPYATTHMPYQVVPNSQTAEMLQMRQLTLMPHQSFQAQANVYPGSPTRVAASMQLPPSPSPVDSSGFEHPISPPVSGSDASTDSHTHYQQHSHSYSRESSSGAGSPPATGRSSLANNTLVQRAVHRYNPTGALRSRRRRSSTNDEQDYSDDGEQDGNGVGISPQSTGMSGQALAETLANNRKEATRRQRIEAEQRRRDELREGYARLKDVLPLSNQKSSKVSLLERATNYIANLDQSSKILHARVTALEAQVARLSEINERLSLTVAHHTGQIPTEMDLGLSSPPPPAPHHFEDPDLEQRPLSPPPDVHPPQPHGHGSQAVQHSHNQSHETLYHHRDDSSASASQASGSEY